MARYNVNWCAFLLITLIVAGIQLGCEGKSEKRIIHSPPPPATGTGSATQTGTSSDTGGSGTIIITGTGSGSGTGTGTETGTGSGSGSGTGGGSGAGDVIIDLSAYPSGVVVGQRFGVPILINCGIYKCAEYSIRITYDSTKLSVFAVQAGPTSGWDPLVKNFTAQPGTIMLSGTNEDALSAYSGTVDICEIIFDAIEVADPTVLSGQVLQIKGQEMDASPEILVFYDIGPPGPRPVTPVSLVISNP
ncbi:MAG: cohesin domain-containing protein [Planctomycetota bacterium]|jgi:hypothetical protein